MNEVVIWGAGAIGGTIGACLARAGQPVLLVDSELTHVAAMRQRGLTITGPIEQFSTPVRAVTPDQVRDVIEGPLKRVMLAVKGQHTVTAARAIAPLLADDGSVLSLQNGLNGAAIASVVGAPRVVLALVDFASDYHEPGIIHYGGRGSVYVGEPDGHITPRVQDYVARLKDFDQAIEATDNVLGLLWGKVAYGGLLIATALTNDTMTDVLTDPRWHPLLGRIGQEIILSARADGVRPVGVDGFDAEAFAAGDATKIAASCNAMGEHYRHSAKTRSGIWRDLAVRKRKTEVPTLLGPVNDAARRHGVATPTVARLAAMITEMENGRRDFSQQNLAELGA
jgi:2-dehydropantoate 2-reductase